MTASIARHPAFLRTLLGIGIFSLALAGFAAYQLHGAARFHGTAYPDSPPAPPFELVAHDGSPVSLEDFRGRPVLLFFGFTRCPQVCPLTLGRLSRIAADEGIDPTRLTILLLTVDPEHDTPDRLSAFIEPFGPNVTAVTGAPDAIADVLSRYGVYAEHVTGHHGGEELAHTTQVFGIDAAGRIRVLIHPDQPLDLVARDIRTLLRIRA